MRTAQAVELYESVPPRYYGGTEREVFERRFTATRMAHDYMQQFERLTARRQEVSEAA